MRKRIFEERAKEACAILNQSEFLHVIQPKGAFYMAVLFKENALNGRQYLEISDGTVQEYIEQKIVDVEVDKRFVYYLLGATGICVVPLTGFCCERKGFRVTVLETDDEKRRWTWETIVASVDKYIASCPV